MVAVVTGASGGIGSEIALSLAENGYDVALMYNQNEAAAMSLAEKTAAFGHKACAYKCDLQKPWEIADTASAILDDFGGTDLIVNNAGISVSGLVTDFDADDFDKIFNTNVRSMFLLNNALLPTMINRKSGCIINISSIWGISGASCEVLYSAAKAAVIGYTKALARELGPSGIRVNAIAPGFIDTKMNAEYDDAARAAFCEDTPLMRIGKPNDIAKAVCFLADNADFITGQTLTVDGGYIM